MRRPDKVFERFYQSVAGKDERALHNLHIPHSSVFYAREAYYQYSGEWITLERMEAAMMAEGLKPEETEY